MCNIDTRRTHALFMRVSLGLFHRPRQIGGTDTSSFKLAVTATAKNPALFGVAIHWITSYVCNGKAAQQHKDRPDPQLVAKNAGTPREDLVSASYTLHFLPVRLWYPLLRFRMRLSRDGQGHKRAVSNAQRRLHCQHLRVLANTQLFQVD
jgi:hypothetical protein